MIIKTFNYKGQMINYFIKLRKNDNISFCFAAFDCQLRKWTIRYEFN